MPTETKAKKAKSPVGVAAFVDIETTGLSPSNDFIIQFSCASYRFNRETGEILEITDFYTGFEEPASGHIPRAASRVNKITWEDVDGQSLDYELINKIIEPAEFIVAHNATFDRSFCVYEFPWANEKPWKCSMRHIKWMEKGQESRKLQSLLKAHGIKVDTAHRADADVKYALDLLNYEAGDGTRYFLEIIKHRAMPRISADKLGWNLPTRQTPVATVDVKPVATVGAETTVTEAVKVDAVLSTATKVSPSNNKGVQTKKRGLIASLFIVLGCIVFFPIAILFFILKAVFKWK